MSSRSCESCGGGGGSGGGGGGNGDGDRAEEEEEEEEDEEEEKMTPFQNTRSPTSRSKIVRQPVRRVRRLARRDPVASISSKFYPPAFSRQIRDRQV